MGKQARLNAEHRARFAAHLEALRPQFVQVAQAMQKLAGATSGNLGRDCYVHAALVQALLAEQGITTEIAVGFAAWRVGEGDGDVMLHAPQSRAQAQAVVNEIRLLRQQQAQGRRIDPRLLPFHAWLEIFAPSAGVSSATPWIFDPTLYQLPQKTAELDAQDGGATTLTWHPDYLLVPAGAVSPLIEVRQRTAGLFYYERMPALEALVKETAQPLDETDVAAARLLCANPALRVLGPNDLDPPAAAPYVGPRPGRL